MSGKTASDSMKKMKIVYVITIILIITSGHIFSKSKGLVLKGQDKYIYVTELLSTGSDDNVVIEFSTLLFLPIFIISLIRIVKHINFIEYFIANLTSLSQITLLFFIEAGSILNTMINDLNIALWLWIMFFVLFIFLTQYIFLVKKCKKRLNGSALAVATTFL